MMRSTKIVGQRETGAPSIAEIAIAACSDLFRGDGEIMVSPTGVIPSIGARLARLTHAPELLLGDGEAALYADTPAIDEPFKIREAALPYRELFELIARGRRHVVMGAAQLDRHGNQNLSAIGDRDQPTRQLLGARAAATNTANHTTSYWISRHQPRVFVDRVDIVTGLGSDRAAAVGLPSYIRRIITDLAVLDLSGPGGTMALVSTHPGVDVQRVLDATGFPLHLPEHVPHTRQPDDEELRLIRERLDPRRLRDREVARP